MIKRHRFKLRTRGMTLTEVVIAMGLVAVLLPMALAVMSGTFTTTRTARDDTRSAMLARSVFSELDMFTREAGSEWLTEQPGALVAGSDDAVVLAFDDSGRFIDQRDGDVWENGVDDRSASYLVRLTGEDFLTDSGANCRKVEVTVSSPAQARLLSRKRFTYHGLFNQ